MAPKKSNSPVLPRAQLIGFFNTMDAVFDQPETKQRVAAAARAGSDPAAVSTDIQGEVLYRMGIDPQLGLHSLESVQSAYQNDHECILKYLKFLDREEAARLEAQLGQRAFQKRRLQIKEVEEQQLKLLRQLRKLPAEVQEDYLHGLSNKVQGISASTFFNCATTETKKPEQISG